MSEPPYEIERKFLIRYPSHELLGGCGDITDIVQTYLVSPEKGVSERVRARQARSGQTVYTHTLKKHISDLRREEYENEITAEEYSTLLRRADPWKNVIRKTRCVLSYRGQSFEIDVYPFWFDRAIMELELTDEAQSIDFPPEIEIIREVTSDKRYTNNSLATLVPFDEI